MASNSGIKTLSRNKVLSNYFMYKFMKKNETKKSFGKLLSWRQLWCCCLMLIAGLLLTDRPAFSQATTQANVSLKLGDGIGCAAGIKPAIRPTADV